MRRLTKPARKKADFGAAALAPMVDMLTILLVFLLKSWSTDPPVRPDDKSFALPTSNPTRARRANPKETCARPANAHDKDAPSAQRTTWTCNRFMAYSFAVA